MPTISPPASAEPQPKTAEVDAAKTTVAPPPAKTEPKQSDAQHYSDSMRELEDLDVPERGEPKKEKKVEQPQKKEPEEPQDTGTEPERKEEAPTETKPVKAAELRVAYERSKETLKAKDAEIAKLQNELKTAKTTPTDDPEKKVLVEKLTTLEKSNQELEKQISLAAYHKSKEFLEKYRRPYQEAWQKAVAEISELTVELEDGTTRQANANDLLKISNMPLGEARKLANQAFGDAANDIMAHRAKLRELSSAETKALADAEKNAEVREKEQQTQSLQERQRMATLWQSENNAWAEKFPRWFKPEDGDEEGNNLLAKGYAMADAAFSTNGDTTPEQRVKLHAELRNKAAAFPRLALRLKQARTRIKELEAAVAEYEKSEPTAGDGGKSRTEKTGGDVWGDPFSELDRLDKK